MSRYRENRILSLHPININSQPNITITLNVPAEKCFSLASYPELRVDQDGPDAMIQDTFLSLGSRLDQG